jgi:hypothetical protein
MGWECLGKFLSIIGVACLALSISPSGDFVASGDSWIKTQWSWIWMYPKIKQFTGTVRINPRLLYIGLLLSLLSVLLT